MGLVAAHRGKVSWPGSCTHAQTECWPGSCTHAQIECWPGSCTHARMQVAWHLLQALSYMCKHTVSGPSSCTQRFSWLGSCCWPAQTECRPGSCTHAHMEMAWQLHACRHGRGLAAAEGAVLHAQAQCEKPRQPFARDWSPPPACIHNRHWPTAQVLHVLLVCTRSVIRIPTSVPQKVQALQVILCCCCKCCPIRTII